MVRKRPPETELDEDIPILVSSDDARWILAAYFVDCAFNIEGGFAQIWGDLILALYKWCTSLNFVIGHGS
jgi:hypothetical protein